MTEFAVLRALGLSPRQLAGWLSLENAILVVVSLLIGTGLGLLISWVVLPFVTLTQAGTTPVPGLLISIPWGQIALLEARRARVTDPDRRGAGVRAATGGTRLGAADRRGLTDADAHRSSSGSAGCASTRCPCSCWRHRAPHRGAGGRGAAARACAARQTHWRRSWGAPAPPSGAWWLTAGQLLQTDDAVASCAARATGWQRPSTPRCRPPFAAVLDPPSMAIESEDYDVAVQGVPPNPFRRSLFLLARDGAGCAHPDHRGPAPARPSPSPRRCR